MKDAGGSVISMTCNAGGSVISMTCNVLTFLQMENNLVKRDKT